MLETGAGFKNSINCLTILNALDAPWCTMTSTHSSRAHLNTLPSNLRELYFPPTSLPEKFVEGVFVAPSWTNQSDSRHAGRAVKGRNEPCTVGGVAWVVASLHNCELIDVSRAAWNNSIEMYNLHELMDDEYHKDIVARGTQQVPPGQSEELCVVDGVEAKEATTLDPKQKKIKALQKKVNGGQIYELGPKQLTLKPSSCERSKN